MRNVANMGLRIKEIRKERGVTQAELAEALGISEVQVSRFESGARRTNTDFLGQVAEFFNVSLSDLFTPLQIPVVGYIGAGSEFFPLDDHEKGAGMDTILAPPGCPDNSVAVKIKGDSQWPIYNDGDVLVYWNRRYEIIEFLNRRCICGLADGRVLIKTPTRGSSEGLFTLTSFNAPPIVDVVVEWAAKIEWVQPR